MTTNSVENVIRGLLDDYKNNQVDRITMLERAKLELYSVFNQSELSIESVEALYFIQKLVDSEDLSEYEFSDLVNDLAEIMDHKQKYAHSFLTRIRYPDTCPDISLIENIVFKFCNDQPLNDQELSWFADISDYSIPQNTTLNDLIFERIVMCLRLCIITCNDPLHIELASSLFVEDETEGLEALLNTLRYYIECLQGKRDIIVNVKYSSRGTEIII